MGSRIVGIKDGDAMKKLDAMRVAEQALAFCKKYGERCLSVCAIVNGSFAEYCTAHTERNSCNGEHVDVSYVLDKEADVD